MKKINRWVLVANSSSARVFNLETLHKLTELQTFVHPESRLHEQDLVSSKPGRAFESTSDQRHAMEPRTTQKDHEFALFAKTLSDYLVEAHEQNAFSELFLIASPNFLGLLRQALHPNIQQLIKKEISKDVVRASTSEILQQINES